MELITKIRQEIERRIKEYDAFIESQPDSDRAERDAWKWAECKSLLSFLDTLQEPEVDDIFKKWGTTEEEYLAKSMDKVHLEMEIATYLKDWEDDEEIGLHLSTDNGCITIELEDVRDLARHFAEWQKKQMMEEAVEWTVTTNLANRPVIYLDELHGFKYGDKVHLVIIKEG